MYHMTQPSYFKSLTHVSSLQFYSQHTYFLKMILSLTFTEERGVIFLSSLSLKKSLYFILFPVSENKTATTSSVPYSKHLLSLQYLFLFSLSRSTHFFPVTLLERSLFRFPGQKTQEKRKELSIVYTIG